MGRSCSGQSRRIDFNMRDDTGSAQPLKIGVWNTAFLGDAILTLPLLRTLKKAWPDSRIHFFVRKGLEGLFQAQPELEKTHPFDKRAQCRSLWSSWRYGRERIAPLGFDLWLSAHASFRSAVVARAGRAGQRIGYDRPFINRFFYNQVISRKFDQLEEIERLLQLTIPLGLTDWETWPELVLPEQARERAESIWAKHGLGRDGRKVVGVHPGSVWPTKQWPEEYYSRLLRLLAAQGVDLALLAGPDETALAERVIHGSGLGSFVLNLAGQLSLPELGAVIARLNVYTGNDSGPLHLAWAQRVPVVAMFGPTVRKLGFYPRGESSLVLERDLPCRPCGLHGGKACPLGHHNCMRTIEPQEVACAVLAKLS